MSLERDLLQNKEERDKVEEAKNSLRYNGNARSYSREEIDNINILRNVPSMYSSNSQQVRPGNYGFVDYMLTYMDEYELDDIRQILQSYDQH
jgi:hypothetical protein